jgi:hypothetical protein
MQEPLTPDSGRARPADPALALCTALLMGACGQVVDVGEVPHPRLPCGSPGYHLQLPTAACEAAQLQLCAAEEIGPITRMEPLDCRPGVGYLDNPGVLHTRCESAIDGHSGERCGAEFMCARHRDDSSCFEFASCSLARQLLRSRVCVESFASSFASIAGLAPAVPETTCAHLLMFAPALNALADDTESVIGCQGGLVCTQTMQDLTVARPLADGPITAYFCAGGVLRHASFLDYSFAPTVSSSEPPVLSSKRPPAFH